MSKLEDILQQEVSSEIGAIAGEAEAKVKALMDAATEKAEALKTNRTRQLEAERGAAIRRAESAAELMLNQARIAARGQAVDQVKDGVMKALQGMSGQTGFGDVLKKLANEALSGMGKAEAVVVNPANASALEAWANEKGLKLISDPGVSNGVRLIAEGGKSQIQNVLTDRLERAWDALSAKAAKAIWG